MKFTLRIHDFFRSKIKDLNILDTFLNIAKKKKKLFLNF